MEESKRGRVGGAKEVLSPSLPNPAPLPFSLAHFSLRFPSYLTLDEKTDLLMFAKGANMW